MILSETGAVADDVPGPQREANAVREQRLKEWESRLQQKDELDAEYRWKAGFCRMMQKKLMRLSEEDIELLYWRYERRLTLREIGKLYFLSKDAINNKINDVLEKVQV